MLTAALAAVLLLLAILAVPVVLRFSVEGEGTGRQVVRLQWAFGLVSVRLSGGGKRDATSGAGEGEDEGNGKRERKRKAKVTGAGDESSRWNVVALVRDRAFRQRVIRFGRDLWRSIRAEDVALSVRIGLGDPADTGRLCSNE